MLVLVAWVAPFTKLVDGNKNIRERGRENRKEKKEEDETTSLIYDLFYIAPIKIKRGEANVLLVPYNRIGLSFLQYRVPTSKRLASGCLSVRLLHTKTDRPISERACALL